MAKYLCLIVAKYPGETSASLENFANWFLVAAKVNNCGIVTKYHIVWLSNILCILFNALVVIGTFKENISKLLVISNVSKVLSIDI